MILYIFRHAQKAMDFNADPDLTLEGHGQAAQILKRVTQGELPTPTRIWSSPKKRAQSTLRPLSHHLNLSLETHESLFEQSSSETISDFRQRIQKVLKSLAELKENEVVFLCSHYDWVSEAMTLVSTTDDLSGADFSHWTPAQHVGFQVTNGAFEYLELKRISL